MIIVTQNITVLMKMQNPETEEIIDAERDLTSIIDANEIANFLVANYPAKKDLWILECMDIYEKNHSVCATNSKENAIKMAEYIYKVRDDKGFCNVVDFADEIGIVLIEARIY